MKGYRKLVMTMGALLVYAVVCATAKYPIDYMSLGLGLGLLTAPTAVSNALEHKYSSKQ